MKWGVYCAIDLYGCNSWKVKHKPSVFGFLSDLTRKIGMVPHGLPNVPDSFGENDLHGLSGFQFIKTSHIAVHCDPIENRVMIDIFSCKDFDTQTALEFSKTFWNATHATINVSERGVDNSQNEEKEEYNNPVSALGAV